MKCRFCKTETVHLFADLGASPLANSFLNSNQIDKMEPFYPLRVFVCSKCFLVQLDEFESPKNIFTDYAYFSSYSETWLNHAQNFANTIIERFELNDKNQIVEIASNDGYLLQYFKKNNIPVLGIEPASNISKVAIEKGIPTVNKFFGINTANELVQDNKLADVLIAFNVLPHVPNLGDVIKGMKVLLKPNGVIVIQFSAYLLPLIRQNQFDVIYHEHFSYFSLLSIQKILTSHGLVIFDVEELAIHGGSLRIYVKHIENNNFKINEKVQSQLEKEKQFGLTDLKIYTSFQKQIQNTKQKILEFFISVKKDGKSIVGYGAPAKGNTLLNYCSIRSDFIDYTVDINPHKQGLYLPGTHIPIVSPERIAETKPDYLVILAWNLKDEIMKQMNYIGQWGGKFVVLIPEVMIYP